MACLPNKDPVLLVRDIIFFQCLGNRKTYAALWPTMFLAEGMSIPGVMGAIDQLEATGNLEKRWRKGCLTLRPSGSLRKEVVILKRRALGLVRPAERYAENGSYLSHICKPSANGSRRGHGGRKQMGATAAALAALEIAVGG